MAETENSKKGNFSSKCPTIVLLPAPLGAEKIITFLLFISFLTSHCGRKVTTFYYFCSGFRRSVLSTHILLGGKLADLDFGLGYCRGTVRKKKWFRKNYKLTLNTK